MAELPIPHKVWVSAPNPVKARMLKESLEFLWDGLGTGIGVHEYICNCISETKLAKTHGLERAELKAMIVRRIADYGSFRTWLHKSCGFTWFSTPDLQDARRRFVLQMIKEFGGVPE